MASALEEPQLGGGDSPFSSTSPIPIAQLSPRLDKPESRYIKATVALIWPYSSSRHALTVLLAEPDFRLRRDRGQIRVHFAGPSAQAVANARIASGDEIALGLAGVEWTEVVGAISTLGTRVDCELTFSTRLILEIKRGPHQTATINVNNPTTSPEVESLAVPSSTPSPVNLEFSRPPYFEPARNEWSSPAFLKRTRLSSGLLFESAYDTFLEAEEPVENGTKKRTRFGREPGSWRYAARSTSPEKEIGAAVAAGDAVDGSIAVGQTLSPAPQVVTPKASSPVCSQEFLGRAIAVSPLATDPNEGTGPVLWPESPLGGRVHETSEINMETGRKADELTTSSTAMNAMETAYRPTLDAATSTPSQPRGEAFSSQWETIQAAREGSTGIDLPSSMSNEAKPLAELRSVESREQQDGHDLDAELDRGAEFAGRPTSIPDNLQPPGHGGDWLEEELEEPQTSKGLAHDFRTQTEALIDRPDSDLPPSLTPGLEMTDQKNLGGNYLMSTNEEVKYPSLPPEQGRHHLEISPHAKPTGQVLSRLIDCQQLPTPDATQQTALVSETSSISMTQGGIDASITPQRSIDQTKKLLEFTNQSSAGEDLSKPPQDSTVSESLLPVSEDVREEISPWFGIRHRDDQAWNGSRSDSGSDSESEIDDNTPGSDGSEELADGTEPEIDSTPNGTINIASPILSTSLRTPHSYYSPLSSIQEMFKGTVDVLAICASSTTISRATKGPRDHFVTLHVTDPSIVPSATAVQIFRPYAEALPDVKLGDGVLLRSFFVGSMKQNLGLTTQAESAWAVFHDEQEAGTASGPPVEYDAAERERIAALRGWWTSLDERAMESLLDRLKKESGSGLTAGPAEDVLLVKGSGSLSETVVRTEEVL